MQWHNLPTKLKEKCDFKNHLSIEIFLIISPKYTIVNWPNIAFFSHSFSIDFASIQLLNKFNSKEYS
jgi:hypothetical protein